MVDLNDEKNKLDEEINKIRHDMIYLQDSIQEEAKNKIEEMNKILENVKIFSNNAILSKFSDIFLRDKKLIEREARIWLFICIILFVILCSFSAYVYFYENDLGKDYSSLTINNSNIIWKMASRVFSAFVLMIGIAWSAKMFKISKNEASINNHKHNMLATYISFATGAQEVGAKDALLLEAAKIVFNRINPGYVSENTKTDESIDISSLLKLINLSLKSKS